jgi:hypothetical protein
MEVILKWCLFLLPFISMAQKTNDKTDKVLINYEKNIFLKIATDSIKDIYNKQYTYLKAKQDFLNKNEAISLNYKFEKLNFKSIPIFRIKGKASLLYNCDSAFENFIEFEEFNKYQETIILDNKNYLTSLTIPNKLAEIERINNPDNELKFDKTTYEMTVLDNFLAFPDSYAKLTYNLISASNNFFFKIFGLDGVLFEVDKNDGFLYARWIWEGKKSEKMLANDYILKFEGVTKIKELAKGNYTETELYSTPEKFPCDDLVYKKNKIILKVNQY